MKEPQRAVIKAVNIRASSREIINWHINLKLGQQEEE